MIFELPFFKEMLLPFLLVFVVVFAILQKSKILGDGKAQIDAMVSLVVGLILIVFPGPRNIMVGILPWMSVAIMVIFVFLILYGFVAGDMSGDKTPKWMKTTFAILAGLFTLIVVLYVSGLWNIIVNSFSGSGGDIWTSVIMIILVIAVVAFAMYSGKKKDD